MNKYKKALKEYLDNESTPKELADKYKLDIDMFRALIKEHLLVEKIKNKSN